MCVRIFHGGHGWSVSRDGDVSVQELEREDAIKFAAAMYEPGQALVIDVWGAEGSDQPTLRAVVNGGSDAGVGLATPSRRSTDLTTRG